ncbi:MAG: aquaporin [Actinomycetota bacterium]|nr:aquaporin [Actinomycetota bacterium]
MRRYLAEFLAAFTIVFLAAGAIVADLQLSVVLVRDSFGPLGVALAYGLGYAIALAAVGKFSGGHANPAVTIAYYIARRISIQEAAAYVGAQLLGALFAGLVVARTFPRDAVEFVSAGVPALGPGTSLLKGGFVEVILTFILVFVIWRVIVDAEDWSPRAPLIIGLTVVACVLVGAPLTGGAMNPARWFGPALVSGQFSNWLVWVMGPIVGALMASALYEIVFLERPGPVSPPEAHPAPSREADRKTTTAEITGEPSSTSSRVAEGGSAASPAAHAAADEEQPPTRAQGSEEEEEE